MVYCLQSCASCLLLSTVSMEFLALEKICLRYTCPGMVGATPCFAAVIQELHLDLVYMAGGSA